MLKTSVLLFVITAVLAPMRSIESESDQITTNVLSVDVGDTSVKIVISEREPRALTFVSLHENEQTAVKAARRVLAIHGGRLIELRAHKQRNISFTLEGHRYKFDPNRIFTNEGLRRTLRAQGPYSPSAHSAVARLRDEILKLLNENL